jgi:hypothetical protein
MSRRAKNKGVLTYEMLNDFVEKSSKMGYRPPDRIISFKADKVLKEIRKIEPGWNDFICDMEVYYKAAKLGIKRDQT